ncbi:HNH endonuclease [Mycobacterium phage West99]|uniref:HNH endonuclease n=22 Tax=Rosebushvirus TaxID=1982900 RepID=A0A109ZYE9_9CAUD|nr:HNH endonuclease [Mycobacterium phage Rosebush]YP_009667227.1 HNH endonuclease [Mycobacterium phage TA17A]AEN79573.1 hypothetical protein ARBITER_68 [Mycobacterium phage Arbiter]AER47301.1 hypothetical protein HEDGEROW_70 [Mycobacterium phage Hedgerow]AIK68844.1 hypothetical protein PBI_LIZLEMON_70 [Mycobacterium phage LizLemon]AMB17386.1 HNH endonuclease [Mycobacterium phage Glass]AUX82127.1 HNH endonuclease [Mycobacterium phage Holeinone]AUX82276.1 HNH endonuclease [Mycobacterium phage 
MPNGNQRGSSADRARRKAWLLSPEAGWGGDGETVPCWDCGVLCGPDEVDLCADRIIPDIRGGTYRRDNLAPHCAQCSHRQGNAIMRARCGQVPVAVREVC